MVQRLCWAVGGGNVMSCAAHVKTAVEKTLPDTVNGNNTGSLKITGVFEKRLIPKMRTVPDSRLYLPAEFVFHAAC